jgi:hypothetical protein
MDTECLIKIDSETTIRFDKSANMTSVTLLLIRRQTAQSYIEIHIESNH